MKAMLTMLGLAITTPTAAQGHGIVRHANPAPTPILNGVTIPPNAEILMLSGTLPTLLSPVPADAGNPFGDTYTQTVSTFRRIKASLETQGYRMSDVVKLTIFLVGDPKMGGKMDFAGFSKGYGEFFGTSDNPNLAARSTVQVAALAAPQFLVEIEATAARTGRRSGK